jgi:hypothetical protein
MNVIMRLALAVLAAFVVGGCQLLYLGVSQEFDGEPPDRYPDVLAVELEHVGDHVFDVAVTISSPYDTPERYADGWRVLDKEGNVLGTHTLLHDHATEQPFTRTQSGLEIPSGVTQVTVEGRDQANGFGGGTITVDVPESGGTSGATVIHDGAG